MLLKKTENVSNNYCKSAFIIFLMTDIILTFGNIALFCLNICLLHLTINKLFYQNDVDVLLQFG